jgi:PadR family transcriptional regulator, regulatory protein PadR
MTVPVTGHTLGCMTADLELTPQMARVVQAFLAAPDTPRFGFELMELLRMSSGTLYPILTRLAVAGWLQLDLEDIDPAIVGRPARRNYSLTGGGKAAAIQSLGRMQDVYQVPTEAS